MNARLGTHAHDAADCGGLLARRGKWPFCSGLFCVCHGRTDPNIYIFVLRHNVVLDGGLVPCILDRGVGTPLGMSILLLYCLMRTGSKTYYISLVLLIELN